MFMNLGYYFFWKIGSKKVLSFKAALKWFKKAELFIYIPVHMQIPTQQKNTTKQCV